MYGFFGPNAGSFSPFFKPIGYTFINAEAEAFVGRMTVEPDATRKQLIDEFFTALKNIGLSKFDAVYLLAAHDQQGGLLNLISTSHNASAVSSPTFTADRGFTTDGSSTYVDTTFNPTTSGVAYTQNSAHFAFWSLSTATISHNTPWGGANDDGAAPNTQMAPRTNSGNFSLRVNDGTTGNVTNATSNGLAAVDRRTSSARRALLNGVAFAEDSTASTGLPDAPFWLGRVSTVYSSRQFAFASVGAHLTDAEHASLHTAVSDYLTAIGAL